MYCRGILKTHGHNKPLVKAQRCVHCHQVYVVWVHMCLKKAVCHIYYTPDSSFSAII